MIFCRIIEELVSYFTVYSAHEKKFRFRNLFLWALSEPLGSADIKYTELISEATECISSRKRLIFPELKAPSALLPIYVSTIFLSGALFERTIY